MTTINAKKGINYKSLTQCLMKRLTAGEDLLKKVIVSSNKSQMQNSF